MSSCGGRSVVGQNNVCCVPGPLSLQGTVPYLGTFLTDLTYIDSAYPDMLEGNLINFEKRRKEFEIIAQIKLFQSAAQSYNIVPDACFRNFFSRLPRMSEEDCYTASLIIQPPLTSTPRTAQSKRIQAKRRSWFDSVSSVFAGDAEDSKDQMGNSTFYDVRAHYDEAHRQFISRPTRSASMSGLYHAAAYAPVGSFGYPNGDVGSDQTKSTRSGSYSSHVYSAIASADSAFNSFGDNSGSPLISHRAGRYSRDEINGTRSSSGSRLHRKSIGPTYGGSYRMNSALPWFYHQLPFYIAPPSGGDFHLTGRAGASGRIARADNNSDSLKSRSFVDYGERELSAPGNKKLSQKLRSRTSSCHSLAASAECSTNSNNKSLNGIPLSKPAGDEAFIIRISLEANLRCDENKTVQYKCLKIANNDRTNSVIARAVDKWNLKGKVDDYMLVQLLPNGEEFTLPDRSNAYYAVHRNADMAFLLKQNKAPVERLSGHLKKKPWLRSNLLRWNSGFL